MLDNAIPWSYSSNLSTLGMMSHTWTLPCSSKFYFNIVIGNETFAMDQSVLVIDQGLGNNTCVGGLEAWDDSSTDTYVLGARFMSTVYM